MGNWLTRDQARELLRVPDRSTLKGKRDYAVLALLVGCALRRRELAVLDIADVQQREGRWVIADLCGKGNRIESRKEKVQLVRLRELRLEQATFAAHPG